MRRALCVLALLAASAPQAATAARTGCYTSSAIEGAAPLTVTFASSCGSAHWEFGDGRSADGESVGHVFAAGAWRVTANGEQVGVAIARAVTLRVPKLVGYDHRLTFRGSVVPALPGQQVVVVRGGALVGTTRTRADGSFGLTRRIRLPGPYAAQWVDSRSEALSTTVKPRLTVRLEGAGAVGQPLAVVARLVPAAAGSVRIQVFRRGRLVRDRGGSRLRLGTRSAGSYRIRVVTTAAPGFTARSRELVATVAHPSLGPGSRGPSVRALEQRLRDLRFALLRVDGRYGGDTVDAVLAFQKVHGLPRTGRVDAALWRRLGRATVPRARFRGTHVEVDKSRQVLFEVRRGVVESVVQVSTGATGNTPLGSWRVYRRVAGWDWVLYYPTYFLRGFAIHGYPSVPPWPASHGCVRVPMWAATRLFSMHPHGFTIRIYA